MDLLTAGATLRSPSPFAAHPGGDGCQRLGSSFLNADQAVEGLAQSMTSGSVDLSGRWLTVMGFLSGW
ncbi:MAG TPA: hypothetical protein VGV93_08085 [Acidimicrobiales bacterium]|nr:hypothetical protein [Acidimicrobiales bacterium]